MNNKFKKGDVLRIKQDKEYLRSICINDGEEIINSSGVLLNEHNNGICTLAVKKKYSYNNNTILDSILSVETNDLSLIRVFKPNLFQKLLITLKLIKAPIYDTPESNTYLIDEVERLRMYNKGINFYK